ncbi:MAG: MBL fold metallo-hydrolase [Planctomycetales bacterium]|nr:MBL fold metallo-hydrolase [Planctomycetales bacterium]
MSNAHVRWKAIVSQPFAENTYVGWCRDSSACVLVDPGFEPDKIAEFVESANLVPAAILNTHGHSDHIAGNAFCKDRWPDCPLVIGAGDSPKLTDPVQNLSAGYGLSLISPPADQTVAEGDVVQFADIELEVLETPGHSSGHVVFVMRSADAPVVLGGDVLFRGSIGRYDFPDSNYGELMHSIKQKLFLLPPETVVLPGHGPATTIGEEMASNPFLR